MVAILIPYPSPHLSFYDWATSLSDSIPNVTFPEVSKDVSQWREWGYSFMRGNPLLTGFPVPLKRVFPKDEDWRKWAIQVIQSLQ